MDMALRFNILHHKDPLALLGDFSGAFPHLVFTTHKVTVRIPDSKITCPHIFSKIVPFYGASDQIFCHCLPTEKAH